MVSAHVKSLYSLMQSKEAALAGGEGCTGFYGSLTPSSMQKVLDSLVQNCGLSNESCFIDVGSGLGRPLLHALTNPGVKCAKGIEIDELKCVKASAFIPHCISEMVNNHGVVLSSPEIKQEAIEEAYSLEEATHGYSFWEGMDHTARSAFGALFLESTSMKAVAVVQRAIRGVSPEESMEDLGFGPLVLADSFSVTMSGSGQKFRAYIFNKPVHLDSEEGSLSEDEEEGQSATSHVERDPAISHLERDPAISLVGPVIRGLAALFDSLASRLERSEDGDVHIEKKSRNL